MTTQSQCKVTHRYSNKNKSDSPSTERRNAYRRQMDGRSEGIGARTESDPRLRTNRHPLFVLQQKNGNQAVRRVVNKQIQLKLEVGKPDDKYEREADKVAEQVVRMSGMTTAERSKKDGQDTHILQMISGGRGRFRQRKLRRCTDCEESNRHAGIHSTNPSRIGSSKNRLRSLGTGRPLPSSIRSFIEPRFGYRFGDVRIHTDSEANYTANMMNARAFTVGQDVVFAGGEYSPHTSQGMQLLAHELVHVFQQSQNGKVNVQRQKFGTGSPPNPIYGIVPEDERQRIERAWRILERIANNPDGYRRCHERFQTLCSAPSSNELRTRLNSAIVWKDTGTGNYGHGDVDGNNIAATELAWRIGHWTLAATYLHELMHNCGVEDQNEIEETVDQCGLPHISYFRDGVKVLPPVIIKI
ncbi:eCIS core domain-containing protein [Haladaptatus sp. NG-SE-30]